MTRLGWTLGFLLGVSMVTEGALAATRKVVAESAGQPIPGLERTALTVQEGKSTFNRFDVVRLHRQGVDSDHDPSVILLAPFGFPAEFWEAAAPGSAYEDSFGPGLALEGYDVWLVD